MQQDPTLMRAVIGVDEFEQGAFPHARRAVEHHAFTGVHAEIDVVQHVEHRAVLVMQGEALAQGIDAQNGKGHGWSTEETSSWV
ncbi:hypothetical protein GALL_477480 [mine drainage metagenome]|uniref:Uncharacterized protein n=1 Tax=mine drainage metagenome TaxID=410659 RepID=A0A1J5PSC5_9ZZZZ